MIGGLLYLCSTLVQVKRAVSVRNRPCYQVFGGAKVGPCQLRSAFDEVAHSIDSMLALGYSLCVCEDT